MVTAAPHQERRELQRAYGPHRSADGDQDQDAEAPMSGAATPMRLLPILLPNRWTTPGTCGQLWNSGSAYGQRRTILGAVPTPTDKMLPEAPSACPLRARSAGQRWELT